MVLSQRDLKILIAGGASDAHGWNLVFLALLLEEAGHRVVNLGPCVPAALLLRECRAHAPDLVVVSSVNGHGYRDGLGVIGGLRAEPALAAVPVVIGGKLGVDGVRDEAAAQRLIAAGYTAVFDDADLSAFLDLVGRLAQRGRCGLSTKCAP
jgi:methylaspartate mutase sigma subunit